MEGERRKDEEANQAFQISRAQGEIFPAFKESLETNISTSDNLTYNISVRKSCGVKYEARTGKSTGLGCHFSL